MALWRAEALAEIAAVTAIAGFCAEMYRPAAAALLADVTPKGRRVGTFALYRVFINLGFALGPATIGIFAQKSAAVVFIGDAVTSVLYGTLVLIAIPRSFDHRTAVGSSASGAAGTSAFRLILRDGALLAFLAALTVMASVHTQDMATVPLQIAAIGYTTAQYGMLISLNGFACMLLELPMAAVTSRLAAWIPMSAGAMFIGLGIAMTGYARSVPALAVTVLFWTLGEVTAFPVAHAFVADLAPSGLQGRYQGSMGFTQALAFILAPAVGAAVYGWNAAVLWPACAVAGLAAALTFAAVGRARHVRTVAEELAMAQVSLD